MMPFQPTGNRASCILSFHGHITALCSGLTVPNMLKEGWDVTTLYTIVPLRTANAHTLIEQSIGRGLRLSYGRKTGVIAVDRLSIVVHDKLQEIADEANRFDSPIRLQQVILAEDEINRKTKTVVSQIAYDVIRKIPFT